MLNLPIPALLVISIIFSVICPVTNSLYAKKITKTSSDYYFFLVAQSATIAITILLTSGGITSFSWYSVLFGALFGIVCILQTLFNLKALNIGPFSYTTVLVALSTIIPTLSGLFFGQSISLFQYIGIALMVLCILFSTDKETDAERKKITLKWLLLSLLAAILNGFIGIMQMEHQHSEYKDESTLFLLSCFVVSVIISFVILMLHRKKNKGTTEADISFRFMPSHILILLGAGVSLGICHVVNLYLTSVVPSATLFPIINICPLVLTTILAMIIFKERLSVKRWIGIIVGLTSTVFLAGVLF